MKSKKNRILPVIFTAVFLCALLALSANAKTVSDEIDFIGRNGLLTMENGENLVEVYDMIELAVDNLEESVFVDSAESPISPDELSIIYKTFRYDHPEAFYVTGSMRYYQSSGKITRFLPSYAFDIDEIPALIDEFEDGADRLLRDIPEDATDYEVSLLLHDRIAQRVTYVLDAENAHNAYSVIVGEEAVCEGYAKAYQYLLNRCGISSVIVAGKSLDGVGHAWNLSELDGKYYYSDVTWDDQYEYILYSYFNITRSKMEEDHIFNELPYALPEANSTDANYYVANGTLADESGISLSQAAELLRENGCVRLYFTGNDFSELSNWFYTNAPAISKMAYPSLYPTSYSYKGFGNEYFFTVKYANPFFLMITDGIGYTSDNSTPTSGAFFEAGDLIIIEADAAPEGAVFDKWVVTGGSASLNDPYSKVTSFFMPAEGVTLKATYEYDTTEITKQPESVSVMSQEAAVFSVEAQGHDLSYTWYIMGGSYGNTPVKLGTNSPVFTYPVSEDMCLDNGAVIYCAVSGADGRTVYSNEAVLSVSHRAQGELLFDKDGHFHLCYCGEEASRSAHIGAGSSCTEKNICTVCSYIISEANGHTPGAAATCTTAQLCTVCKEELVPAKGHTSGNVATCTTAQTCTVCNTVIKPAKGHTPGENATCNESQKCTVCGEILNPNGGHTPGAAATCTTAQLCTVCKEELAPAKGHTLTQHESKAPTCTEIGWAAYETCSACDYTTYYEIPVKGHTPGTAATCTTAKMCTVCNAELAHALGHDYAIEWTIDIPASTTAPGEKSRYCTRCDARTDVTEIPKLFDSTKVFTDVKQDWYTKSVDYVVSNGLMNGTSETTFEPEATMTRAMLVTVLYRLEGKPTVNGGSPFTDLDPSQTWYHDAIAWAHENKIVNGTSDTTFSPDDPITREQMATILFRYAGKKGYDTSKRADLSSFPDGGKTSDWATEALSWAYAEGLITGSAEGGTVYLVPNGSATRAQVATILMRFCEKY